MLGALARRGRRLVHHATLEALVDLGRGRVPNAMQAPPPIKVQLNALLVRLALFPHLEHQCVPHVRQAHSLSTDSVNLATLEAIVCRGLCLVHHATLEASVDLGRGRVPNAMQEPPPVQVPLNALLV